MSDAPQPHDFVPPEPEEIAKFLPGYVVQAFIAKGGMGAVYMARQKSLDRQVAIKILPSHFGGDAYLRSQFESEAKNMAKLNHPNVISVHDFGEFGDQPYIVMEMVQGKSLYHSARGKRIDPRQAGRIIRDICRGLAHAHEQGILHRDLKPANVLLDPNRTPKIGDFGLARHITDHASDKAYGTPGYTAPEVASDREAVDESTDIYSVGVMLYELLSGKLPEDPYTPVESLAKCDPAFDRIIRKAIDPSPTKRYRSAKEMAKAIDEVIKEEASSDKSYRSAKEMAKAIDKIIRDEPLLSVAKLAKPVKKEDVPIAKRAPELKVATLPVAERSSAPATKKILLDGVGTPKSKSLIFGPITRGQTRRAARRVKTGSYAPLVRNIILIGMVLFGLNYAWKAGWLNGLGAEMKSLFASINQLKPTSELPLPPEERKVHPHELALCGTKEDTGLVNLDGEKTLDWVVFTGVNVSGARDQMPERAYQMNPSSSGNFTEAARKGIPVFFEAGGKELTPMAATSAKAGKAKAGHGWNISMRVPKQHKGSMLVTLYMFQVGCGFDVEVIIPEESLFSFSIPKQDPGVLRIPIEIPKVQREKNYQIKITSSKDTTGDFSMGLNAVHIEGR